MRLAALLPMRHGSERLPGKNWRPCAGRPLYHWVVAALRATPGVDEIVIDTDSPVILADAAAHFPGVRLLARPPALGGGRVAMNEVLLNTVDHVAADWYLQTHATNPLLRPATIAAAIAALRARLPEHDSLFSVTRRQVRLWDGAGRALNHDPEVLLPTQELTPVFEENSCLYLFTAATLRARRNRIGYTPLLFEMDREEAVDIDDALDFRLAECLIRRPGE